MPEDEAKKLDRELALTEYNALVNLEIYEGQTFWNRFSAIFAIDAALLATIGVLSSLSQTGASPSVIIGAISLVGFSVSTSWLFMSVRAHSFYTYWLTRAQEIEESDLFKNSVYLKTYQQMGAFFDKMKKRYSYRRVPVLSAAYVPCITLMAIFAVLPISFNFGLGWVILLLALEGVIVIGFIFWGVRQHQKYHGKPATGSSQEERPSNP